MKRLSASLIKDVLACQKRGYFRIYTPEEAISTDEMAFGSLVHKIIEEEWNTNLVKASLLADKLLSKVYMNNYSKDDVLRMMGVFYKNFQFLLNETDITEKFFVFKIGGNEFVGKMDRVTKDGIIYDWKTSKKESTYIQNDIQAITYYLAYEFIYNRKPKAVYFANLNYGKLYEYTHIKENVDVFVNEIVPYVVTVLKEGKFIKDGLFRNSCPNCNFINTCWGSHV